MHTASLLVCFILFAICVVTEPLRYEAENAHIVGAAQRGTYLNGIISFFLSGVYLFIC
jgi:hypothetical protein